MHPFWAVRRVDDDQLQVERQSQQKDKALLEGILPLFNAVFIEKEFSCVAVGAFGEKSLSVPYKVTVPMITNSCSVPKGSELLLHIPKMSTKKKDANVDWKKQQRELAQERQKEEKKARDSKRRRGQTGNEPQSGGSAQMVI